MIRTSILTAIFLLSTVILFADIVPKTIAEKAAYNYLKAYYQHKNIENSKLLISNTIETTFKGNVVYYTVVFNNNNFVHIAADDASYPILGFSTDGDFNSKVDAINYKQWMQQYALAIDEIITKDLQPNAEITNKWKSLINPSKSIFFGSKSATPLLLSKWNQDSPYNAECPADANGPGGKVYAGCVAIAMAQVMYYYRYPDKGIGSHSYYHSVYGSQSADFASTIYNWNKMQNIMSYGGNFEIAQLLYHVGVSVDMDYSGSGSGAYSFTAAASLKSYFGYQNSVVLDEKSDFSEDQWKSKIIASIDNKIPLYYHGRDSLGMGGHAFNLDGYQGDNYFHFNWGWGGSYNGYFYLSLLNPGGGDFTTGQGAIFNIYPASNYPKYCNSTLETLTGSVGTLTDGSGTDNYLSNSSCEWLIQPTEYIEKIKIIFDRFDVATDDTLYIYDGQNASAPLLGKYSGSVIPSYIVSTTNSVFLKFITTSSIEDQGFAISYSTLKYVYCNGIKIITDSAGIVSDGSGLSKYNSNTFCKWSIKPTNGLPIKFKFDSIDTENGIDNVKFYDPVPTPSVLLGIYSGTYIPQSIISPSGQMLIVFVSNPSVEYQGWSGHYYTAADVSIDDSEAPSFTLFPNPTKNVVNIRNNTLVNINGISIYSMDGKLVKEYRNVSTNSTEISLDIKGFSKGIYFIKIRDNSKVYVHKIMIL